MGRLDLDAARAARAEQRGEAPVVGFGGVDFVLPPEPPFAFLEGLGLFAAEAEKAKDNAEDVARTTPILIDAVRELFTADDWETFKSLKPSYADMMALVNGLAPLYGLGEDVGESQGSEVDSSSTGEQLKPTSPGTTESISPEPATETQKSA